MGFLSAKTTCKKQLPAKRKGENPGKNISHQINIMGVHLVRGTLNKYKGPDHKFAPPLVEWYVHVWLGPHPG